MADTTLELAQAGDINAIAALIEEKIGTKVNPRMRGGIRITLILETPFNNVDNFTKKIQVLEIIKLLKDIHCKIPCVKISGNKFQKTLTLSEGEYKDETLIVLAILFTPIYILAIGLYIAYVPKVVPTEHVSPSQSAAPSQPSTQNTNPDCLYIPESTIAGKSGEEVSQFKDELKRQSGKSCVLFSGG